MSGIPTRRIRMHWAAAVPLVAAGLLMAGCGGSSTSSSTSTASSGPTTTGGSSSQLKSFGSSIESAKNATFKAVYTSTSSGGGTETITLAQSPPKQVFSTTDSSGSTSTLLNTGTATYSCDGSSGATPTCLSLIHI